MKTCVACNTELKGRQTKYCSNRCKMCTTNQQHQNYAAQQARARKRKVALIEALGGRCQTCGYKKSYAALTFHHKHPGNKKMKLTSREISNNRWELLYKEAKKCMLLCANCHLEKHYPDCMLESKFEDF